MNSVPKNDKVKLFTCLQDNMIVSVRDVDPKVFKEFKAKATYEKTKTGTALTHALLLWLSNSKEKPVKKTKLSEFPSWDWGPGTENASREVDQYVYGGKK